MPKSTDLKSCDVEQVVVRVLDAVAGHFTEVHPTEPMDAGALAVTIAVEAYNATGRSIGNTTGLAAAVTAVVPELDGDITRGEYALRVRRVAADSGQGRGADDNDRVVPRIPGQRIPAKVPKQPQPKKSATAPTMTRGLR